MDQAFNEQKTVNLAAQNAGNDYEYYDAHQNRHWRRIRSGNTTHVIMLAMAEIDDHVWQDDAGADDCLTKPISLKKGTFGSFAPR